MWIKKYKNENQNQNFIITTICLIIYILNQIYLKQLGIPFFNNYLNDLLAVPLFFSIINIIAHYNNNKQLTSFKHLFLITIILSFMGEYLAKYFRPKSITDPLDIIRGRSAESPGNRRR